MTLENPAVAVTLLITFAKPWVSSVFVPVPSAAVVATRISDIRLVPIEVLSLLLLVVSVAVAPPVNSAVSVVPVPMVTGLLVTMKLVITGRTLTVSVAGLLTKVPAVFVTVTV